MSVKRNAADDILSKIGFGRWQILHFVWLFVFHVDWSSTTVSIVLIGFVPDFACRVLSNETSPPVYDNKCFRVNSTNVTESCSDGFIYAEPKDVSIISEWDLVCGQSFLSELSQTVLMVGLMIGSLVSTQFSDRFGRLKVLRVCHAIFLALTVATAFVPNIFTFIASRLLVGAFLAGTGITGWVAALELCTPENRPRIAMISNLTWAVLTCFLPAIGYAMEGRSWRHLQLVFSVFAVFWVGQYFTVSESLRWLLANDRNKDALKIIRKAAKVNKINQETMTCIIKEHFKGVCSINNATDTTGSKTSDARDGFLLVQSNNSQPDDTGVHNATGRVEKAHMSCLDITRHHTMRKFAAIISLVWFTDSMTYTGINMLSSAMPGNRYLNLFLNCVVEIPSALILTPVLLRFGRRTCCVGLHALAGVSLITAGILHVTTGGPIADIVIRSVMVLAKFGISSSYMVIVLYTPELYPTNIRAVGVGAADVSCRLAGFIAPFAATVARAVPWVPACVFGGLSLLVAFCSVLLPETAGRDLPETLDDVTRMDEQTFPRVKTSLG